MDLRHKSWYLNFQRSIINKKSVEKWQIFFEIADEMENECGDWENLPEIATYKILKERIINKGKDLLAKRGKEKNEKG